VERKQKLIRPRPAQERIDRYVVFSGFSFRRIIASLSNEIILTFSFFDSLILFLLLVLHEIQSFIITSSSLHHCIITLHTINDFKGGSSNKYHKRERYYYFSTNSVLQAIFQYPFSISLPSHHFTSQHTIFSLMSSFLLLHFLNYDTFFNLEINIYGSILLNFSSVSSNIYTH
ncbi:MAG: hypothetical protein ACI8RD_007377, partial [Bacillariaceae sp.]|jgi:hypothetical protein